MQSLWFILGDFPNVLGKCKEHCIFWNFSYRKYKENYENLKKEINRMSRLMSRNDKSKEIYWSINISPSIYRYVRYIERNIFDFS